jgi:predicted enzyme related to lactoylglutathione lyase
MITLGHVEIPGREVERLAAFYRVAFGWAGEPLTWAGPAYCKLRPPPPPRSVGVAVASAQPFPQPMVVLHVTGETLAAVIDRVRAAGGDCLVEPHPVAGFGWYAIVADPEGNRLGLWRGAGAEGDSPAELPAPG